MCSCQGEEKVYARTFLEKRKPSEMDGLCKAGGVHPRSEKVVVWS